MTTIVAKENDRMKIFEKIERRNHEQVTFFYDENSGLKAIIAIHDTTLGPSLGGCRMMEYDSDEEALNDVLRLSRAMTYKAAIAGLNLGGGKAVIIGNPKKDKTEALFRAFGRFIEGLGGRYITAEDVGTRIEDMEYVRMESIHVTGLARSLGGGGDPSPVTAKGTLYGIMASVKHRFQKGSISGMKIAIQGLGHVGMHLSKLLHEEGVELYVTDIDQQLVDRAVKDFGATAVAAEEIYGLDVDIFAPCALGAVINDETIGQLNCKIIAGAANNQLLKSKEHGAELMKKGILYAPDYVINSGGLINAANEYEGYSQRHAFQRTAGIYDTMLQIYSLAEQEGVATNRASDFLAEERLRKVAKLGKIYRPRVWGREYFTKSGRPVRS